MSRMERIMGIPQESKKPSSLKYPRDPPGPRHINKQAAIDIARKLKLTTIGKVGLRITNSTSIDSEMMSKYNNQEQTKEVSQKSLMDRRKGLEMARNIVESRVGKCIMETNDYEVRRFNREYEKLLENEDQTKRLMIQKKREFVHHKQKVDQAMNLTRRDGSRSPMAQTSDNDRPQLPTIYPVGAVRQQTRDASSREDQVVESRRRSPGYMRPLSCTRDKSHDSAVGETERFLNSPYMRACISNINDEEATNRVLEGIEEANEAESYRDSLPKSRAASAKGGQTAQNRLTDAPDDKPDTHFEINRSPSRNISFMKHLLIEQVNEIKETPRSKPPSRINSPASPRPEASANRDHEYPRDSVDSRVAPHPDPYTNQEGGEQKPPSRGKFLVELIKSESFTNPESPAILVESFRAEGDRSATPGGTKMASFSSIAKRLKGGKDGGAESPDDGSKKSKKQSANSLTVAAQIALLRTRSTSRNKKRRAKKIASMNARNVKLSDRTDLMADPRFTRLADSLIPDSGGSTDLYHSKGKFSLPDHVAAGFKSNASRTKDSKFRQSRNLHNLMRFEELLDSL
ncbi:uncharacterized protein LOC129266182 [Lytechinus pictus]|uniref:uncharacterized protein LOC129266182 n=1 Tax=Lytechinus pictus TaxID=7653 RepID=UPI0030B9B040